MKRINIGCGMRPTLGWDNYDGYWGIHLANFPLLVSILKKLHLIDSEQRKFIVFAHDNHIRWANAGRKIPLADQSVDVVYCCHMAEHLDREEIKVFLSETRRILAENGILRIVVPDLARFIGQYYNSDDKDADAFMERTGLTVLKPKKLIDKFKVMLVGLRHHYWMYDGRSLLKLVTESGFTDARLLAPGETMIPDAGELNLREREDESIYLEARKTRKA